jgi:2-haloacid dehalogenase
VVKALIFDVFGTVVDWRTGVAQQAEAFLARHGIAADPTAFADAWRAKYQPALERVRSGARGYVPLDILHRENLEAVLVDLGIDVPIAPSELAEFARAWEKLPPWPDSVPGLTSLKARHVIAPCSNGSIAMMTWLAKYAGLPWDAILGADIAQAYKPQPEVYLKSAAALGLAPHDVMMVAAHNKDLFAAREQGFRTGFVIRPRELGPDQTTNLEGESDWDVIAADFRDLARRLEGSGAANG